MENFFFVARIDHSFTPKFVQNWNSVCVYDYVFNYRWVISHLWDIKILFAVVLGDSLAAVD